jgi:uncharacterized protein (TIGR00297 family)
MLIQILLGIALALVVSLLAWRAHSLSSSGALAAFFLGTLVFGLGGLGWAALLLGFFISSSLFSRLFKHRKHKLDDKSAKGSQRDWGQVVANGGIGGIFIILHLLFPQQGFPWLAFAGSMAAVNADTWATELGVLSKSLPRLISSGKRVEQGTSGGVSWTGSLAALAGAGFIALLSLLLESSVQPAPPSGLVPHFLRFSLILVSGFLASLLDSYLGATVQAIFTCPSCQKETERHPLHTCGSRTVPLRGWRWLNNDWVNTACAAAGALLPLVLSLFLPTRL